MKIALPFLYSKTTLLFALLVFASANLGAQILTNGDFETGGSGTGFMVHDYTVINPLTGTSTPGTYARTTNPALMNAPEPAAPKRLNSVENIFMSPPFRSFFSYMSRH